MFKDTHEGQTHSYNDGCDEPAHNFMQPLEQDNDDPEITEKDFEDMYISQGKNELDKMERRFKIWLEKRDDDFTLDIWDFRCLQDFITTEKQKSFEDGLRRAREVVWELRKYYNEDRIPNRTSYNLALSDGLEAIDKLNEQM